MPQPFPYVNFGVKNDDRGYGDGTDGFLDLSDRYARLDAKNDPMVEIEAVVPWEEFRPVLEDDRAHAHQFIGLLCHLAIEYQSTMVLWASRLDLKKVNEEGYEAKRMPGGWKP